MCVEDLTLAEGGQVWEGIQFGPPEEHENSWGYRCGVMYYY